FIVFDWNISRPYRVVAKSIADTERGGKPKDYLTEYHFSAVARKPHRSRLYQQEGEQLGGLRVPSATT
ncbi:MAG TPA: hypothetical protein VN833_08555, partial [Candidatus Acidoferrales bacterium]|nr:hypothetical protein [Candidatus Acidoferrales bacterium]